ncbi:MAG: endonuclease [Weeksellaceae bacterium]|nr:endonuclease [Weeksellaceae bacterium]
MRKSLFFVIAGTFGMMNAQQIPTGYYDGTSTLTGAALKTKLASIILPHTDKGYGGLWTAYQTTDRDKYYDNDNSVLDMYSENPAAADPYKFTITTDQCGSYSVEGDCYNREHTVPQSLFDLNNDGTGDAPMHNDIQFIPPVDGKVNGMRNNYPYGPVANPTWTSKNGSKLGPSSYDGYSGTVFEPINEFKGDIARMLLYFVTCYETKLSNFDTQNILGGSAFPGLDPWELKVMLLWNKQDPVSQTEIDRNDAAYTFQKNRNPYIDHPEWVTVIWGAAPLAVDDASFSKNLKIAPNPVKGNVISVTGDKDLKNFKKAMIYNMVGQNVQTIENPFQNGNTITLNSLPKGIYILKTGELNTKFIVE